ncbi:hypothetical protein DPMN_077788 [Dreissena polymorpha]|uniref:Uncharacterized protein n=1 Tax=Dreissena polymorpha TaxID=45954 RepID=A0A9D3YLJ6_DREPO|nr:hypothetical protein DPMN_077788 [Dreissena polymorpha]
MATVRQYDGDNAIERWRHCDDTTATYLKDESSDNDEADNTRMNMISNQFCIVSIFVTQFQGISSNSVGGDSVQDRRTAKINTISPRLGIIKLKKITRGSFL